MFEVGVVREVKDGRATVVFERTEACKACGACTKVGAQEVMVVVDNTENAKPGDTVAVAMDGGTVMSASLIMYGAPLLGLIAGVGIPMLLGADQIVCAVVGLVAAFGAYGVIRLFEPKLSKKKRFKHRMDHIVKHAE